jgi:hypothetical protein
MFIQLGLVLVPSVNPIETSLTRWWNVVLNSLYRGLQTMTRKGGVGSISLTIQIPDLISYRQVPVLLYPFRKEALCCGGRGTYHEEDRKHYDIVNECRTASDSACVPHDFLPCQAYSIYHRRVINLAKGDANHLAYLVRQGQEEVIEEDGGDRN